MARINIDISGLAKFAELGIDFTAALNSNDFQKRATAALSEIGRQSFYRYADSQAAENKSSLHHMYEWGMVGDPEGRLFSIWFPARAYRQGYVVADARFLQSKTHVIEDTTGANPPDTRAPRTFANKAEYLETGPHQPQILPKAPGGVLAFFSRKEGKMMFSPETNPVVGSSTSGQFARMWNEYWMGAGTKEVTEKAAEPVRIFLRNDVKRLFQAEVARAQSKGMMVSMGGRGRKMVQFWDRGRPYRKLRTRPEPQKFNSGLRTVYGKWNRLSGR